MLEDEPRDEQCQYQLLSAGVLSENGSDVASYTFIQFNDGSADCYDIYNEELLLNSEDYNASGVGGASYLTDISNLRILFSSLGLKGFLTGTDDVDKIENYSDITLIGKFEINIDGENGNFTYSDLLNQAE